MNYPNIHHLPLAYEYGTQVYTTSSSNGGKKSKSTSTGTSPGAADSPTERTGINVKCVLLRELKKRVHKHFAVQCSLPDTTACQLSPRRSGLPTKETYDNAIVEMLYMMLQLVPRDRWSVERLLECHFFTMSFDTPQPNYGERGSGGMSVGDMTHLVAKIR